MWREWDEGWQGWREHSSEEELAGEGWCWVPLWWCGDLSEREGWEVERLFLIPGCLLVALQGFLQEGAVQPHGVRKVVR